MISYDRVKFRDGNVQFSQEDFDSAKALWDILPLPVQMALHEVLWQEALDIALETSQRREENSDG